MEGTVETDHLRTQNMAAQQLHYTRIPFQDSRADTTHKFPLRLLHFSTAGMRLHILHWTMTFTRWRSQESLVIQQTLVEQRRHKFGR